MIVDTSVIVAMLRQEADADRLAACLNARFGSAKMSAANYLEVAIVIDANNDATLSERLDAVLALFAVEIAPVSPEQARKARQAYRAYGKGRHTARLNFGDCFAYALSKATGEPLLFKGDDFTHTDVVRVSI